MSKKQNNKSQKDKGQTPEPKKSFMEAALSRPAVLVNTAANIGLAVYVGAKAGAKAGLATGALGAIWTVASAAYWESIERERKEREKNDPNTDGPDASGKPHDPGKNSSPDKSTGPASPENKGPKPRRR